MASKRLHKIRLDKEIDTYTTTRKRFLEKHDPYQRVNSDQVKTMDLGHSSINLTNSVELFELGLRKIINTLKTGPPADHFIKVSYASEDLMFKDK